MPERFYEFGSALLASVGTVAMAFALLTFSATASADQSNGPATTCDGCAQSSDVNNPCKIKRNATCPDGSSCTECICKVVMSQYKCE